MQPSCFKAAQWSAAFIDPFLLFTPPARSPLFPPPSSSPASVSCLEGIMILRFLAEDDTLMDALMTVQDFQR